MAAPGDTQGSALVGFGGPLKEIANLYNTTSSASTPSTKDLDQKEFISPVVAQLAQVLAEHLKGTMAAQTPGNISNTVPETPDSAIVSPGQTSQTRESSFTPMRPHVKSACTPQDPTPLPGAPVCHKIPHKATPPSAFCSC